MPSFAGGDDLITALAAIAAIKGDRARARLIQRDDDEIEEISRDYLGEEAD